MTTQNLTPRETAIQHIQAALKAGVRGELRDALKNAETIALLGRSVGGPTDLECQNLKSGLTLKDPQRVGLLLKHGPRTGKVWVYRYKKPNTNTAREYQFGSYPQMPLSEARDVWDELRTLRGQGLDPATVHTGTTSNTQTTLTIRDLKERFIQDYASKVKRSWEMDERILDRHLVPSCGDMAATDFGHKEAAELLNRVHAGGTPRMAEKLRSCLLTMFNVAIGKTRKISTLEGTWLPPTHPNPIESVMLPQRKAKNHKPTRKELSAYLNALDAIPGGGALLFQALTMTRIAEAVNLCWSELDLEEGIWTLPASRAKNGQEHVVLLSPQAVSILEDRHKTTQGDFVFASPRNPKAAVTVNNVQHQLAKARPTIGLPDSFTSHSIRHAALTWAAENGCPRDVRDRLTNHVSGGGIDAVYNGASLNAPAKEWWKKWADHLDALKAPNVVPMAEAKA